MRAPTLALWVFLASGLAVGVAEAQLEDPFARELRLHWYEQLEKRPWRAFGWELLLPGAGSAYIGLYVPAAITLGASLAGASLWVTAALRDRRALEGVGIGIFAAARAYGAISAPITAVLLNAAFRRQLGIEGRF